MSENMICGKCGIEIHSSETGLRHYGHFTAHSEQRCVALLQEQLSTLRAQLTQSQAELAEVIAIRELAIQFYILGNPEKLIEYITENIDLGKYLEPTHE